MKRKYKILFFIIAVIGLLFAFRHYNISKRDNERFDNALEGSNKGVALIGHRMLYLSFAEESFLKYARHGDPRGYLNMFSYGMLTLTNNPRVWEDLKELDLFCDSVFNGYDAMAIKNSEAQYRKEEKIAFENLQRISKEFCSIDLMNCQPEETQRRIKELLDEWNESKKVLTGRMISSKKRFYLLNTGRYE